MSDSHWICGFQVIFSTHLSSPLHIPSLTAPSRQRAMVWSNGGHLPKWCSPFFTHMVHGWATDLSAHSFVIYKKTSSHQATGVRHISAAFQEAKLKPPWDSSPCSSANTAPRQADLRVLDVIWTAPRRQPGYCNLCKSHGQRWGSQWFSLNH